MNASLKQPELEEQEAWRESIASFSRAFRSLSNPIPGLSAKIEELRNRRDTVEVKARALERHEGERLSRARQDYDEARAEMRVAWQSLLATLNRESELVGPTPLTAQQSLKHQEQ